jgi:hypothetical protein
MGVSPSAFIHEGTTPILGIIWSLLTPDVNNFPMGLTPVFRESGLVFPGQCTGDAINRVSTGC